MKVTIQYAGNDVNVELAEGATVGSIISNPNYRAVLGFADNVEGIIDGVTVAEGTRLTDGDELDLVTKAATKAA